MAETPFPKERANPRFTFFAEAEFTLRDGASVSRAAFRIKRAGLLCCVDALQPIPIGTELLLSLSDGATACELPGRVIYVNSGGGLGIFGIGVLFGEMTVDQHSAIDIWLRQVARRPYSAKITNRRHL